ncbi:hypothetical protein H351_31045 (plasmid) [Rhodococcus erythropolis R138]|nr:hypothetical protein H351_31045 [Rhodococcus erythropolis R138]
MSISEFRTAVGNFFGTLRSRSIWPFGYAETDIDCYAAEATGLGEAIRLLRFPTITTAVPRGFVLAAATSPIGRCLRFSRWIRHRLWLWRFLIGE